MSPRRIASHRTSADTAPAKRPRRGVGGVPLVLVPLVFVLPGFVALFSLRDVSHLWVDPGAGARLLLASRNSVLLASASAAVAVVLGGLAGLLAARARVGTRRGFEATFLAILAVPIYVHAVGFTTSARFVAMAEPLLYSFAGACLVLGWALSPFVFFFVYAAALSWPCEWEDAALLDASPARAVVRVMLPLAVVPAVLGGGVVWLLAFGEFSVPDLLFSRDPQRLGVFATEIQVAIGAYYDFDKARRLSALFVLPPLLVLGGMMLAVGAMRAFRPLETWREQGARVARRRHAAPATLLRILVAALALPLAASLAALLATWLREPGAMTTMLKSAGEEMAYSLALCGACAAVTVGLAIALACGLDRLTRGTRLFGISAAVVSMFAALPFLLPASVLGVSVLRLFTTSLLLPFRDTPLPLALVYLLKGPAFVWPLVFVSYAMIPKAMFDLARVDGCGSPRLLRHVVAPQCWRAWVAAFGLALILFLGEIGAAVMVCAPGHTPLSVRIQTVMHYGPGAYVSALCVLAAVMPVLAIAFVRLLLRGVSAGTGPRSPRATRSPVS